MIPSLTIGSKFIMDSYNFFPYFGWGTGAYFDFWETDLKKGGQITVGGHANIGGDYYVNDAFSFGAELRYDWIFNTNMPNILNLNLRITLLTFNF